ncbi:MAG: helix-turn-helix domain-containing protein [Clostridia bacterium]|nr:helix-turn-helix domain-containing protein [Clostridia bacterium]
MLYSQTPAERQVILQQQGFCVSVANSPNCRLHGHNFLEFSYIAKGRIEHTIGGNVEQLSKGDYFIVDYGTSHRYRAVEGQEIEVINLLFYPGFVDRTLSETDSFEKVVNSYLIRFRYRSLNHSPAGVAFHDTNGAVFAILQRILREYTDKEAGHLEYIRCLVVEMLILIMRYIGKRENSMPESDVILQITNHVKNNYTQRLRLGDFARKYCYSLSHLSKKFREETGQTFMEYLQRIRMEQACKMLEENILSVSEIAEAVGYSDLKFFQKVFRENLGVSPSQFRKMSKKN